MLKIMRVSLTRSSPTYGVLTSNDIPLCVTLERPWKDNQPSVSCIPEGTYKAVKYSSPKHPNVWEITGVKDRTSILIHIGNTINDSEGCILAGLSYMPGGVAHSHDAIELLRKTLPDSFDIEIINPKET